MSARVVAAPELAIRTPENVVFAYELAGLGSRLLAWALDATIILALVVAFGLVFLFLGVALGGLAMALWLLVVFAVQWFYFVVLEWWLDGQTLGKRVLSLRVIDQRGFRLTFFQAAVRNLVRVADLLPGLYLAGAATALLDPHGRRLGDLAAGTVVVRTRAAPMPAAIVPPSERHNTFIDDPAVRHAARRIDGAERDVMVSLALRREQLPLAVRHALYERLARHLTQKLDLSRPAFFSDEKLVLNLTAIVLGATPGGPSARSRRSDRGRGE